MAITEKGIKHLSRRKISHERSFVDSDTDTAIKTEAVLLCLAGPGDAETALPYVENYISSLVPMVKAKIYLLQVITEVTKYRVVDGAVTTTPYSEVEKQRITKEATHYLDKIGEPLRNLGVTVVPKVKINKSASMEIINTAREINADLIVMFTHRKSWLDQLIFGSVSKKVIRLEEQIPVKVVQAS